MSDILSVAQLVSRIKVLLESNFRAVNLEGEVSNLSLSSTGHWYFTLSDASSSVSVALFRGDALRNPLIKQLKDGDKVIVAGSISVYQKRGTFQIITKRIFPKGKGDLKIRFENLKNKLSGEGLFDAEIKKKIPAIPQKIAIITAQRGAALQDFLNVFQRRSLSSHLVVVPALVQGDASAQSLREALFKVQKYNLEETNPYERFDLIVFTRGGGSLEDLWSFNDEGLAYDIYNCETPIISAIGHQVDYSIADFVADMRCETPTAAAEVITEFQMQLLKSMEHKRSLLINCSKSLLPVYRERLTRNDPNLAFAGLQKKLSRLELRLSQVDLANRSEELVPGRDYLMQLEDSLERAKKQLEERIIQYMHRLEKMNGVIHALGPQNVLMRGYSYLSTSKGKIISGHKQFKLIETGSRIAITFHDGKGEVRKV